MGTVRNEKFYAEAAHHHNDLVLCGWDLCRCIGYAEDEDDSYFIMRRAGSGSTFWQTFAGGYIWLTYLRDEDHNRLEKLLTLNSCPHEREFIVDFSE